MKMPYGVYVFSRTGRCLYAREWDAVGQVSKDYEAIGKRTGLLSGLVFSMRQMAVMFSTTPDTDKFKSFATDTYSCHLYETPTKLKIVVLTAPNSSPRPGSLEQLYSDAIVSYIMQCVGGQNERGEFTSPNFDYYVDSNGPSLAQST